MRQRRPIRFYRLRPGTILILVIASVSAVSLSYIGERIWTQQVLSLNGIIDYQYPSKSRPQNQLEKWYWEKYQTPSPFHASISGYESSLMTSKRAWHLRGWPARGLSRLDLVRSDTTPPLFRTIGSMPNLDYLNLSHTPVTDDIVPMILKQAPDLREIDLSHTRVSGHQQFEHLAMLKPDCRLHLDHTRLDDLGLRNLSRSTAPFLTSLNLEGTLITDQSRDALSTFSKAGQIDLSHTAITEQCLLPLDVDLLKHLDLANTEVPPSIWLNKTNRLPNLKYLDLSDLTFRNTDLYLLKQRAPNLEELVIAGTMITDEGLRILGDFPRLSRLNVRRTKVTHFAVRSLIRKRRKAGFPMTVSWFDRQ